MQNVQATYRATLPHARQQYHDDCVHAQRFNVRA